MEHLPYHKTAYKHETIGTSPEYSFGIQINIGLDVERDLTKEELQEIEKAAEAIEQVVITTTIRSSPKIVAEADKERRQLLALFDKWRIAAIPIPNGHCSKACCKHLPWFQVVIFPDLIEARHPIGITIGWRKRVISITWEVGPTAEQLFPNEVVTKTGRTIHAWGYDKAGEYLDKIIGTLSQLTS